MGRYYEGDIEGKFVFGAQSSTAADRFGVEGTTPGYVDYNISFEDYLEKLNKKPLNRDQLLEIFDYRLGKKIQACIKEQGSCSFTAEL